MSEIAIDVRSLSRRFGRRWALMDVSLQLARGAVMMVAGQNGAGKTTLLRVLATLLRPNAGAARIADLDVVRDREKLRRRIALLSHYSYLYESLTARENLDLVRDFQRAETSPAAVRDALEQVGLSERADDAVSTFSAGMRKRLSFARVLLQPREVVLLDEPYGNLDPQGFALVDDAIGALKRRGATVVVATHQIEHVAAYADRVLTLENGRVAG